MYVSERDLADGIHFNHRGPDATWVKLRAFICGALRQNSDWMA